MPRLSIKAKLSLVISILVLAFIAFNVGYYPRRVERQIRVQAETSARQVAETAGYALAPALGGGSLEDVSRVLEGVKNLPAFSFSVVFDAEGRQVDSTPSAPAWARNHADGSSLSRAFTRGEDGVLVATAPVFYREPHRDKVGTLVLGFTTEDLQRTLNANIRLGLYVGLAALGLGLAVAIFISNLYVHPVLQLTAAAQQVAQGHLDEVSVRVRSRDELQELGQSFQAMTQKLRVSRDEIGRQNRLLEFRVQERTRQLMETIWELEEIRANLEQLVQERTRGLEQSRTELKAWAETLEEKVREKTLELQEANAHLLDSFQQLQQLDRMKDEFLANMSHELRTPLNAVIGFSGLLLQESAERIPQDVREDLEIILQNGRSLLGMIDSLLDLSKIEAGRFELDLEEVDPLPVLDEVRALGTALARDRGIGFRCTRPEGPVRVMGDPLRFRQILTNLLGNAVKFTEQGEVEMAAEVKGDRFVVSIRDTGIGMNAEEVGRLFVPFQQVDGSITRRFGGTGLGLALSKRLAELMHGVIRVESAKGKGSTFAVELPLVREEQA